MRSLVAVRFVTAIAVALVLAEKREFAAVGLPSFLALVAIEYAEKRPEVGEQALRREIDALRTRWPDGPG